MRSKPMFRSPFVFAELPQASLAINKIVWRCAVYQDTLNGCPTRSTNPAVNDAARINSTNPRAFRPTGMTPLDGNSNRNFPLSSTFDPWYYYQLSPTYQVSCPICSLLCR